MSFFIILMNYKLGETVHDIKIDTPFCKTPGLKSPKNYVLPHKCLNTFLVLIFSDSNKAQVYKMPYRDSPHHEIELVMSFE